MMNDLAQKIQRSTCLIAGVALILAACVAPEPQPEKNATAAAASATPAAAPTAVPADVPVAAAEPEAPVAPPAATPVPDAPPVLVRASWDELPGWRDDNHAEALPALVLSCRVLGKDAAWRDACAAVASVKGREAARVFFETRFTPHRVVSADGVADGFITGYYEPILRGSRKPSARYKFPLYALPDDLLTLDLGTLTPELSTAPRVRVDGRRVVPYHTRAIIDSEASPLRGREIVWVDNEIEVFFLHVQGSGRVELDEGGVMRVGFAGHNGHPYRSIGRVLIERGDLALQNASMQGIKAWAQANPARLTELLNQNARYVFFRELAATPENSPPGALGVPLTPQRSIAVDRRYVPLGAPVHIATTWPNTTRPLQRLMLAQDIGGAIRGAVRADFFWGAGEMAAREAGRMQQALRMWVLLPRESE